MCIYIYIYTMEHYTEIKNNEVLPFETIWIDLDCIILSEILQAEKNKLWFYLFVESKTKQNKQTIQK